MLRLRAACLAVVLLLVAAACGQKPGVALSAGGATIAGQGAAAPVDDGTGAPTAGEPAANAAVEATPGAAPAAGPSGATPGPAGATATTARPGGAAPAAGTAAPTAPAAVPAGPNDKVGVTDKEIVIGIHAPVTGAAPFPQSTFEEGREVYWVAKGPVHGRTVHVVFFDDQFNPSRAVQVCREMVEKNKVFLLVGGGGADQISACAKYANQVGVPYLSAGVNQSGLDVLKTYFALSLTYSQQSPILASMVKNKLGKSKLGIVVADTPSFADARQSFTKAATDAGLQIVLNKTINKNASQSETLAAAGEMQRAGAEVVYILTSPTVFIQYAQSGASQGYNPQYIGPGISAGLNTVATVGCPGIGEARFLSPFFQLDDPASQEYKDAYQKQHNKAGDDIGFALWGLNAMLGSMLEATGPDLGRAAFMAKLRSSAAFSGGIYPEVKYTGGKPFGGTAMHLLKADCGSGKYVTEAKNVTGF